MARIELRGTMELKIVAAKLKAAGGGQVVREMNKSLKISATPVVRAAQANVRGISSSGGRGGASARAARAAAALGRRKRPSERAKTKAHRGAGLRATTARAVSAKVSVTSRSASLRVRAAQSKMPRDQRSLPRRLNRGRWRHPVFGRDYQWVTQTASPEGWFDRAADRQGRQARDNAIKVVTHYYDHLMD